MAELFKYVYVVVVFSTYYWSIMPAMNGVGVDSSINEIKLFNLKKQNN